MKDAPDIAQKELPCLSGTYYIAVNYYDHLGRRSKYEIFSGLGFKPGPLISKIS